MITVNDAINTLDINFPLMIIDHRTDEVLWEEEPGRYEYEIEPYENCRVVYMGYWESAQAYYLEIDRD